MGNLRMLDTGNTAVKGEKTEVEKVKTMKYLGEDSCKEEIEDLKIEIRSPGEKRAE